MKKGFTLVELLVTIAIMGTLYLVVFGSISGSKAKARDDKRISDIKEIQLALNQFFDGCSQYPATITSGAACPTDGSITFGAYLSQIPKDPSTSLSYYYYMTSSPRSFCVGATLEVTDPSGRTDNSNCNTACALSPGAKCFSVKNP